MNSENVKIVIGIIGAILFIVGLVWRSCGTEIEATCPHAKVRVIERGSFGGNPSEGVWGNRRRINNETGN